jgi:hypothetical protein
MSIKVSNVVALNDGDTIDEDIVHMSMPPTLKAMPYQTMYVYGNHIRVTTVE